MHWHTSQGIYLTGEYLHLMVAPVLLGANGRCTLVLVMRPRFSSIALPRELALLIFQESEPAIVHYGRLHRLGQAQIVNVAPGLLRARSLNLPTASLPEALLRAVSPGWISDRKGRAAAADSPDGELPQLQHADGDLSIQLRPAYDGWELLVTAQQNVWADALVAIVYELVTEQEKTALQTVLLPLGWYDSLGAWGGQVLLPPGTLGQLWPPYAPLELMMLNTLPSTIIQASVAAAAATITLHAWHTLAARPDVSSRVRSLILSAFPSG
ncbi:hypothetical protein EYB53_004455 [Candidatus Chloroploca sp. M-50]|uniref:Uncharacterized protein n=1 Tax=Candidatus Chloroploca mongolica TaxID=2528176 RepID=A0ABS4D690_9CHLR|nr:hypothetical protein [Candidatus Chloroploca mongolica]MBP1464955.1 hypothetical protein [Candidatus Chloroploca mongolica]